MPPARCLKSTVRQSPPSAVGFTHADAVMPVVSRTELASLTVTQSLTPSKVRAPPKRPEVVRVAPLIVPVLPAVEASGVVVPDASSKPQAPTRPEATGQLGASVTVKAMSTVFGEPETPAAVTVTVPVCRPGASPAVDGVTETVRGAASDAGVTVSHGTLADAVKESVPPPELVTLKALVSTVAAPCAALNESAVGETESCGGCGGGSTVSVTGIERGEPVAPAAVTVTVAV